MFLTCPALAGRFFTTSATWEAQNSRAELTNKNANYRIPFLERASHVAQLVKHLPTMWETWVQFLGWEVPLEKEIETHTSILIWRITWTEEPERLQFMASLESNMTECYLSFFPFSSVQLLSRVRLFATS